MKREIKYAEYTACYGCGVPQEICPGWEEQTEGDSRYKKTDRECQYKGVIIEGLMGLRSEYGDVVEPDYQEHMRESRVKEGDFQVEAKWLGSAIEWHAYDCSRSAREFYKAAKEAQKVEEEISFEGE